MSFPELLVENYCKIATHIDENTWKSWIFVCKTFLAMIPRSCRPRRKYITGYIDKSLLRRDAFCEDYPIDDHVTKLTHYLRTDPRFWDVDRCLFEIHNNKCKIRALEAYMESLKPEKFLQSDLNPKFVNTIEIYDYHIQTQQEDRSLYYALGKSFYKQPIDLLNLLNNISMVGKKYEKTREHVHHSFPTNIEVEAGHENSEHDIYGGMEMYYDSDVCDACHNPGCDKSKEECKNSVGVYEKIMSMF
jgi:hypothetical protein